MKVYKVVREESFLEWMQEGSLVFIIVSWLSHLVIFSDNIPYNENISSFQDVMMNTGVFFSSIICGASVALIILYIIYLISVKRVVKVKK